MLEPNPTPLWMRLVSLFLGAAVLLWLPREDQGTLFTTIFGITASGLVGAWMIQRRQGEHPVHLRPFIVIGLVSGVLASVFSVGLMVLKNGIHAHGVPDFLLTHVLSALYLMPIWMIGGSLIGLGAGLLRLSRR